MVPIAESGVEANGANLTRMHDLVGTLHGSDEARFLGAPAAALAAKMYHADLRDCINRFRWEKETVVVTPETFWVSFAIELAARVQANTPGLQTFRLAEPVDIGMVPNPGGTFWPSDDLSGDMTLFPGGIPMVMNTFHEAVMVQGSVRSDFSHHAVTGVVAAHGRLVDQFRVAGEAPFWVPNFHRLGGECPPPGPFPAIEPAATESSWAPVEKAIRRLAEIARESCRDGETLAVWADGVADLARDLGAACGAGDGVAPSLERMGFRISMLLAPSTRKSQVSNVRFRHKDRDMSMHFGIMWSDKGPRDGTVVPRFGWILSTVSRGR